MALTIGLVACGGDSVVVTTSVSSATTTTAYLQDSMDQLHAAMTEVELSLSTLGLEDLDEAMLAWSDLSSDLESSLKDLERDPTSVDLDGLEARINSFQNQFGFEPNPAWDHLVESFDVFVDQLEV